MWTTISTFLRRRHQGRGDNGADQNGARRRLPADRRGTGALIGRMGRMEERKLRRHLIRIYVTTVAAILAALLILVLFFSAGRLSRRTGTVLKRS